MGAKVREKPKGSGVWWVFVTHGGKRTSRRVGKENAANKVAETIEAKLTLGQFDFGNDKPKEIPTFKQYADAWIKNDVPAGCKESTVASYQAILDNHVLPVFQDLPLTEIKKGTVKDFLLEKLNGGYSANTVCHMKDVISGVLNKAIDDDVIADNPALTLRMKKALSRKSSRESINPLEADELKTLLDAADKHYKAHYSLFLLLARTGMRIGEALALRWGDIDFKGRFIEVKRSTVRGQIVTPKSDKHRRVDMSRQLAETLKAHHKAAKKKGLALGLGEAPEFVFTNNDGHPIDKDNWRRRVFAKALEKAELRKIRIHDLRHTYATLRISKGDNIADVSNQLGHHSVKLTMDVYYHWVPGRKKDEVDGLDDAEYLQPEKEAENAV